MGGKAINPTTGRNIRVPDDLWEQFGKAVDQLDTDRTKWLIDAMKWCVRHPGSKLPKRPDAGAAEEILNLAHAATRRLTDERG